MNTTTKRLLAILTIIFIAGIALLATLPHHKGEWYIRAFAKNEFFLDGELCFFSDSKGKLWQEHVTESHFDGNCMIDYPKRHFSCIDGQYFIKDSNGNTMFSTNELNEIDEIFTRASIISHYDYSNFNYSGKGSEEIILLSTGTPMELDYEDYILEPEAISIRLYYANNQLYAIRAKEDPRFIFYVLSFSRHPQR